MVTFYLMTLRVVRYGQHLWTGLLCIVCALQGQTQDSALLWKISGNGLSKPSYLFGTIHLICPESLQFSDALQSAFQQSEKLCLEMDMDQPGLMLKTMRLSMQVRQPLKELFTAEQYAHIDQFLKDSLGIGLPVFHRMRPFTLLSALYTKVPRCRKPVSVEEKLMEIARRQRKEVDGLETLEDQFGVFDQIPDTAQARMIWEMIQDFSNQQTEFLHMVEAYRTENLPVLSAMTQAAPDMAGFEALLLQQRNRRWIPMMQQAMSNASVFFAVGAGHLAGKEGLLSLLRKAGYSIEALR